MFFSPLRNDLANTLLKIHFDWICNLGETILVFSVALSLPSLRLL